MSPVVREQLSVVVLRGTTFYSVYVGTNTGAADDGSSERM
jgi:hypothetical protein